MIRTLLLLIPSLALANPHPGELPYQINCIACHQLDHTAVGPSLVNIAKVYPAGKKEEFIAWANKPGKKNPKMVEMPSMAHVGNENLGHIHDYILQVTKGVKHKKTKGQFKPVPEPQRDLPYVRYAFLPDASPASLAIIFPGKLSACWDTEACRLRYLWQSGVTNPVNHRDVYQLPSPPFHRETADLLWSFAADFKPKYLGYRLLNRQPEFHYSIGKTEIRELVTWDPSEKTLTRRFKLENPPPTFHLNLQHDGDTTFSYDQGTLSNNTLKLTSDEAREFTLTLTLTRP